MTSDTALWTTLHEHLPRKTWIPIGDIYRIVELGVLLDAEDLEYHSAGSSTPRWKFNVRRVLRSKQREGKLVRRTSAIRG